MDRCLNIMPLFHVHGASVVCTPGFYVAEVLDWMKEFQPTWFTAVPAIHQAILNRVAVAGGIPKPSRLLFIRSCSSALSPKVMAEMERTFDLPVIEAYGMTEASLQMASNPLPPRKRKPGSVGVAAGAEMAIMDDTGRLLSAGNIGEIVVRGDSSSPANQIPAAFHIFNLNEESRFSHRTLTTELRSREMGAIARVLGLGVFTERRSSKYFLNDSSPAARAVLANSRQVSMRPGNRSVRTPNMSVGHRLSSRACSTTRGVSILPFCVLCQPELPT